MPYHAESIEIKFTTTCHLLINNAGSGRWKMLGAKTMQMNFYYALQFTKIPQSLGPNGKEAEISVQTTTAEKRVAENVCSKFKADDVFCRNDYLLNQCRCYKISYVRRRKVFFSPTNTAEFEGKIWQMRTKQNIIFCCYFYCFRQQLNAC